LRCYTIIDVELRCFGVGLKNGRFLDPTFYKKHGKREPTDCAIEAEELPDHRRRELSFEVRGFVYLKVSPMRGLCCFKVRGELAPRFIGPFKILEKRGEVTYQLELLQQLSNVDDVFHVSQLTA
jgi:hypothetical protein